MKKLVKEFYIKGLSNSEIAKQVLEGLRIYGSIHRQRGFMDNRDYRSVENKLNLGEKLDMDHVEMINKFITDNGLEHVRDSYVVLCNKNEQRVIMMRLYSDKCLKIMDKEEFLEGIERLKSKVNRIKHEQITIIGYMVSSEEDHWTEPIGIDMLGRVYQLIDVVKLRQCNNLQELFEKHVEYEEWNRYSSIEIYENELKYDVNEGQFTI